MLSVILMARWPWYSWGIEVVNIVTALTIGQELLVGVGPRELDFLGFRERKFWLPLRSSHVRGQKRGYGRRQRDFDTRVSGFKDRRPGRS